MNFRRLQSFISEAPSFLWSALYRYLYSDRDLPGADITPSIADTGAGDSCILIANYRLCPFMIHHWPAPPLLLTFMWSLPSGIYREGSTRGRNNRSGVWSFLKGFSPIVLKSRFKVPIRPIFTWTEPLLGCLNLIVLLSASVLGP